MSRKKNESGKEMFEEYYSDIYRERWPRLREAMLSEECGKISPEGLVTPYFMDYASILTSSLLPVAPGMKVLDMCAAPGGKSLVLALRLKGKGLLVSNDRSMERRRRMRDVFSSCLPSGSVEIKITGFNAESWGVYEKEEYDAVLLDAPCSSERHVMKSEKYLSLWSPSRPRRLAISQYSMLSSALLAVKKGGYILYSTCSINPGENEEIIRKLLSRHSGEIEIEECNAEEGEKREYGTLILPDTSSGRGPMYSCLIRKLSR